MGAALAAILALLSKTGMLKDLAEVVIGNRRERDEQAANADARAAEAQGELWKEYGSEFTQNAPNRTLFDKIMDGVNRLPRPMFAFGTIAWFFWCAVNPDSFERSMRALNVMSDWGFAILSSIIVFYFGGRMIEKTGRPRFGGGGGGGAIAKWKASRKSEGGGDTGG